MTGTEDRTGAQPVRSSNQAAHRHAPAGAQPPAADRTGRTVRTAEEVAAVRFFWGELLLVAAMSIAGNVLHAWLNAPTGKEWAAAFVASFPPVALLAATHGVGLLVRAKNKARAAYWSVVVLTGTIAVIAFRLSFDALRGLSIQVGMSEHLAWLFPLIVDGAIGQATIALLVLARSDLTSEPAPVRTTSEAVRAGAGPVRSEEPVRTVAVRQVRTETYSHSAELTAQTPAGEIESGPRTDSAPAGAPVRAGDRWAAIAESVCEGDHAGRRDPAKVATILRLKFDEQWSHSRIAEHVELSPSAVTRTLTAAKEATGIRQAAAITAAGEENTPS